MQTRSKLSSIPVNFSANVPGKYFQSDTQTEDASHKRVNDRTESRFALGILLICCGVLGLGPGLLLGQPGRDIFGFLAAICFVSIFAAAICSFAALNHCRETLRLFAAIKIGNIVSVICALLLCVLICSSALSYLDRSSPLWFFVGLLLPCSFFSLALSNLFGFISVYYLRQKTVFFLFVVAQFVLLFSVILSFLLMVDISSAC